MRQAAIGVSFILFVLCSEICCAQANEPVAWRFSADSLAVGESTLRMSATLAPGWHLYSQFLNRDGPVPTRFTFRPADDYVLVGVTRESGDATKFYDSLYEMQVVWYAGEVVFEQNIRIMEPQPTIHGIVEYMVCNEEMCIPSGRRFSITVSR